MESNYTVTIGGHTVVATGSNNIAIGFTYNFAQMMEELANVLAAKERSSYDEQVKGWLLQ